MVTLIDQVNQTTGEQAQGIEQISRGLPAWTACRRVPVAATGTLDSEVGRMSLTARRLRSMLGVGAAVAELI